MTKQIVSWLLIVFLAGGWLGLLGVYLAWR